MGRMSHPNLVKLLGYCLEERDLLLVYEFMSKGSLENHLFRSKYQYSSDYDVLFDMYEKFIFTYLFKLQLDD